jgi:hypothetical protein
MAVKILDGELYENQSAKPIADLVSMSQMRDAVPGLFDEARRYDAP